MKFEIDRADLLAALAKCNIATESNSPHTTFRTIFLSVDGRDKLSCFATTDRLSVKTTIPAGITETGKLSANAKKLTELVSSMPEGRVLVSSTAKGSTIKSKVIKRSYNLNATGIDQPMLEQIPQAERTVDAAELMKAWDLISFGSPGEQEVSRRPGAELRFDLDRCALQTHNGHVMARAVFGDGSALPGKVFVPERAFSVARLMAKDDAKIRVAHADRRLYLLNTDTVVSVQLPEVGFPEEASEGFARYVEEAKAGPWATLSAQAFTNALKSVMAIGIDIDRKIPHLKFQMTSELKLSSTTNDGDSSEELELIKSDGQIVGSFNGNYLFNAVRNLDGEAQIKYAAGYRCLILGSDTYSALIMEVM